MANSAVVEPPSPPPPRPSLFHDLHFDGDIHFSIDDLLDFPDDEHKIKAPLSSSYSSHRKENTMDDEKKKRKTRLMRNRENAQLSRKRKKLYVEELEEKVRSMHSTISDLNSRIGHCLAENVHLRHQLGPTAVRSPFPSTAIAPMPPLVPIPKLRKPREAEEKTEARKVAGVSLIGFLFITLVLTGLDLGFLSFGSGGSRTRNPARGRVSNVAKRGSENASQPLVASLHIPRNEKMVKVDGNLVISSVLASERAFRGSKEKDLDLGDGKVFSSALAVGSGSTASDGRLQDWFLERLEGPIFSSGMCTEVFQFDASIDPVNAGGIVPATSITNATTNPTEGTPYPKRLKNRRTLCTGNMSVNGYTLNDKKRGSSFRSQQDGDAQNATVGGESMVVSTMIDPKEEDDDGKMPWRTISRIFVVVRVDGVKYVTYSCTLPFKSNKQHLVTT